LVKHQNFQKLSPYNRKGILEIVRNFGKKSRYILKKELYIQELLTCTHFFSFELKKIFDYVIDIIDPN